MRFGFNAFVGASFAEIFAGNCTALGLPCVTLDDADLAALLESVELDPGQEVVMDLEARRITSRAGSAALSIPEGVRGQLLSGTWDATSVLLEAGADVEATAARLPYVSRFGA